MKAMSLRKALTAFGLCILPALPGACSPGGGPSRAPTPTRPQAPPTPTAAAEPDKPPLPSAPQPALLTNPTLLTDKELADGWISLFDGQTLYGWEPQSDAKWRVEGGTIVADGGAPGLLLTTSQFSDYELQLQFRSAPGANSGVFLHTLGEPLDPARDCYELNIAPAHNPFPTGSLVQRQKASGNFDSADWQTYEATVAGGQVVVQINGQETLRHQDPAPLGRGRIGLQYREGKVEFRQIKLKPWNLADLCNGKDLTGWKTYPEMDSVFSVSPDGLLNVKGGSGQLETEAQYGDFVLQLECMTRAANLNSGVFYRCLPGERMNGYEIQIHNGFGDGDRTKPHDCGTGGIFRRQNARLVAADDLAWFHLTVAADGPHVAAWVNGLQVSDWTDQRPPDENPRKGLRLKPGTIMLQGHDPTTDIAFRNLRAAEMAQRSPRP